MFGRQLASHRQIIKALIFSASILLLIAPWNSAAPAQSKPPDPASEQRARPQAVRAILRILSWLGRHRCPRPRPGSLPAGRPRRQGQPHRRSHSPRPPGQRYAEQIADITAFLHARAAEALNSAEVPKAYPVEKLLTGNAEAGKAFFDGAGACKNCHSPTGDLSSIASKYSPIELEARMLYPEGKHITTAVVTLPSGEQVKGPLVRADDFVIAMRDASGWYRSFPRDRVKVELQDPLAAHRELLDKLTQADVHNLFAYLQGLK